jgi:hypothetical protein
LQLRSDPQNRPFSGGNWLTFSHDIGYQLDNGEKPVIIRLLTFTG